MDSKVSVKRYAIYLLRWQLSTPVMLPVTMYFGATILGAFMANLIGGLIFFWIDKFIFGSDRNDLVKKYAFYLGRWQLTSITLYPCLLLFGSGIYGVVAGNFIGGLIFFWVDKYIFANKIVPIYWEIKDEMACHDCGKKDRAFRLVKARNYDRSKDKAPQYRCDECSRKKTAELKARGIEL